MSEKSSTQDPTSISWPHWLLRFVATDDAEAFNELIWSVGGSPPYGGVSFEEASAVYELLEQYQGPGMASEAAYDGVVKLLDDIRDRIAIEVFRVRDRIGSSPDDIDPKDVETGLGLSRQLDHPGCVAYFSLLGAELAKRLGDVPEARQLTAEALTVLAALTLEDRAYMAQMIRAGTNGASLAAMDGDLDSARQMLGLVEGFGDPVLNSVGVLDAVTQLHRMLGG